MKREESNPAAVSASSPPPAGEAEGKPATRRRRRACTEVVKLKPEYRELTDRLLTEGSTFEEVVETVAERKGPRLTLGAVRDYFRHNLTLQMQRVRYQKRAADALRAALGDPESAEGELAAAAFLTGFMCLGESGSEPTLKDAEVARLKRENQRLQQRTLRMKERREIEQRSLIRAQAEHHRAQTHDLKVKVREVRCKLKENPKVQELAPEVLQKIEEIYGIVQTPPPYDQGAAADEPGQVA
jgi:hypothetical protein